MQTKLYDATKLAPIVFIILAAIFAALTMAADTILGEQGLDLYLSPRFAAKYWIDIIPHALGGIAIGWMFLSVDFVLNGRVRSHAMLCATASLFAAVICILWEQYEIRTGEAFIQSRTYLSGMTALHVDQVKDVLVGITGALLVVRPMSPVIRWLKAPA